MQTQATISQSYIPTLLEVIKSNAVSAKFIGSKLPNDEALASLFTPTTTLQDLTPHIITSKPIYSAYFSTDKTLNIEVVLPFEEDYEAYIYGIALAEEDELISLMSIPPFAKVAGIGGTIQIQTNIEGESRDLVFKSDIYLTEEEFNSRFESFKKDGMEELARVLEEFQRAVNTRLEDNLAQAQEAINQAQESIEQSQATLQNAQAIQEKTEQIQEQTQQAIEEAKEDLQEMRTQAQQELEELREELREEFKQEFRNELEALKLKNALVDLENWLDAEIVKTKSLLQERARIGEYIHSSKPLSSHHIPSGGVVDAFDHPFLFVHLKLHSSLYDPSSPLSITLPLPAYLKGSEANIGAREEEGLPAIRGELSAVSGGGGNAWNWGFYPKRRGCVDVPYDYHIYNKYNGNYQPSGGVGYHAYIDASLCSPIYGRSQSVEVNHINAYQGIYAGSEINHP